MTKSLGIHQMHGRSHTRAYSIWHGMLSRCNNSNEKAYPNYGGRGIKVCERWKSFINFVTDMGDPPPGMSVDRIDNDKGYEPENCRWVDRRTQNRNKRNNRLLTIKGETLPLSVWVERTGIPYQTASARLRLGWPAEDAVSTPIVRVRKGLPRGTKFYSEPAKHGVVFHDPVLS